MSRKTGFAALCMLATISPRSTAFAAPPVEIEETKASFESKGKAISVERFAPTTAGKHPAVVLLHGSGGMEAIGGGFAFRMAARDLAKQGYIVFIPHYFERTGTTTSDRKSSRENFIPWMETIGAATLFASTRDDVDPERIGLVGFSLGGFLANAEAIYDPRVKVVVDYFGGLPDPLVGEARKLKPTLILHGDADPIVPIAETEKLAKLLKANQIDHEVKIYQGQGHGFFGADGRDAAKRTAAFLDKHLKK